MFDQDWKSNDDVPDSFWYTLTYTNVAMFLSFMVNLRHVEYAQGSVIIFFEIFNQISSFLVVLILCILCFANSFYSLSEIADEEVTFNGMFDSIKASYTLALGDFGQSPTEISGNSWNSFFIFFISSILLMIIYANILITVVSEGFNAVKEKKMQFVYKDKCEVILACAMYERLLSKFSYGFRRIWNTCLKLVYYCSWKNVSNIDNIKKAYYEDHFRQKCELLLLAWEDPRNIQLFSGDGQMSMEEKIDALEQKLNMIVGRQGLDDDQFTLNKDHTIKKTIDAIWEHLKP